MRAAVVAYIVEHRRRSHSGFFAALVLTVEYAHRVALEPAAACVAQLVLPRGKILAQRRVVVFTAIRAADRVYFEPEARHAELTEYHRSERYHLGVRRRVGAAEHLRAELVELAQAARLRSLAAEAGYQVVEPQRHRSVVKPVLKQRAHYRGGTLWSERNAAAAAVLECIHFLLHDVGRLADAAAEQLGVFKGGEAYFPEAAPRRAVPDDFFRILPDRRFLRQYVRRSARRFNLIAHVFTDLRCRPGKAKRRNVYPPRCFARRVLREDKNPAPSQGTRLIPR